MSKTYLLLGANGDLCSCLPILYREYLESGDRPRLIVAKDYAGLLSGLSYIEPIVFSGHYSQLANAQREFSSLNPVPIQVYGSSLSVRKTDSFVKEMWVRAGANPLQCGELPLAFDRRNPGREWAQIAEIPKRLPWVLLSTSGHSSPFQYGPELSALLNEKLRGRALVVDVSEVRAPEFYDMLGFMDEAKVLVTVDSGLLHLSLASLIPTVAFIVDRPDDWHGSPQYPNQIMRLRYNDFPWNKERIIHSIEAWL